MTSVGNRTPRKIAPKPANRQAEKRTSAGSAPLQPLPKPLSSRAARAAERRAAIIEAALEEFIARGFTATRIDDVAKRAGVAKGTIYLHFKDKEALFQELVRTTRRRRSADRYAMRSRHLPGPSSRRWEVPGAPTSCV